MNRSPSPTPQPLPGMPDPVVAWCAICGRVLTNPESIQAGVGPICAGKHHKDDDMPRNAELDPFDPETMNITCRRLPDGTPVFNIEQRHRHHSPTGMEWGYAGSGPADFALNILALFLPFRAPASTKGVRLWDGTYVDEKAWSLHQHFKEQFISAIPEAGGTIPGQVVREWIDLVTA